MATVASEHYLAGRLDEAVAAATAAVKAAPGDAAARMHLAEMLCFAGDLDRADKQLDAVMNQDTSAGLVVALFRHLVRAEQARRQFHAEGRVPEVVANPSEDVKLRLEASVHLRQNDLAKAGELLHQAEEKRQRVSGTCDGQAFDDIRDLDDLTASVMEVLTANGKYYWVPFTQLLSVQFRKPERPKDLLFRAAHIEVTEGPGGDVYIPALSHGTHAHPHGPTRLGRATDWTDGGGPVRGIGLRTFLVGDGAKTIMEMQKLTFKHE